LSIYSKVSAAQDATGKGRVMTPLPEIEGNEPNQEENYVPSESTITGRPRKKEI
jgi:hypothetical protein